jgi:hypothetical protein
VEWKPDVNYFDSRDGPPLCFWGAQGKNHSRKGGMESLVLGLLWRYCSRLGPLIVGFVERKLDVDYFDACEDPLSAA